MAWDVLSRDVLSYIRFETWSLNVFKLNDVILNDVMATSYRATRRTSMKSPFHHC